MSKGSNLPAIERATGISWPAWVNYLDANQGATLKHYAIAQLAEKQMDRAVENSGWWAQSVAVAYEQHIGRRLPGQAADGSFQFSVTRTLAAGLDDTLTRWIDLVASRTEFNSRKLQSEPRISGSDAWRYWRMELEDGSAVSVDIGRKGEKSSLAINHRRIHDPDQIPVWKEYWRSLLRLLAD